jgi:hypothetical protein
MSAYQKGREPDFPLRMAIVLSYQDLSDQSSCADTAQKGTKPMKRVQCRHGYVVLYEKGYLRISPLRINNSMMRRRKSLGPAIPIGQSTMQRASDRCCPPIQIAP